jgi:hypothetical protein
LFCTLQHQLSQITTPATTLLLCQLIAHKSSAQEIHLQCDRRVQTLPVLMLAVTSAYKYRALWSENISAFPECNFYLQARCELCRTMGQQHPTLQQIGGLAEKATKARM